MTCPRRFLVALLAAAALLTLYPDQVAAQLRKGKALRPETRSCVDCHKKETATFNARASRHQPVREGNCESCHLKHGVVGVLRLKAEDPQLCLVCHAGDQAETSMEGARRFSHPPGDALKCGACHDPHGAELPHLMKQAGPGACLGCHSGEAFQGASAHSPEAADCLSCHAPHGSTLPGSLVRQPSDLCSSCHTGSTEQERRGHGGLAPPSSTCLGCHTPHASPEGGLLRKVLHAPLAEASDRCGACHTQGGDGSTPFALPVPAPDLCVTCHEDPVKAAPAGAPGGEVRGHPPAADGDCLACHVPHASDQAALLKLEQPELCGSCHTESRAAKEAKAPHAPATRDCSACHEPHAGPVKLLRAQAPELCLTCHEGLKEQVARPAPHPPAAAGECLTCHDPHGSGHDGILKEAPTTLCVACHDRIKTELEARVTHPPASSGACVSCHEPHGSVSPHLVIADLSKACLSCHRQEESALPADRRHAPFAGGDCAACHRPHSSPRDGLLTAEAGALCRSCHANLAGETDASSTHLPVRRGQCLSCHGPHGGETSAFLKRADARTLCLSCHAEEGRLMVRSDLHVHPPFRSESCLACHKAHASREEALLARAPSALCASCHDPVKPSMTAPHRGLTTASTDCTGCHEPHAAESKKLLLAEQHAPFGQGDCAACHQGSKP